MRKGVVLPNLQWVQYPDSVYQALEDLRPQSLEVLVYNPDAPASPAPAHMAVVQRYCQDHPGTTLLLRPYSDQIAEIPPTAWAETCYQWCYHWQFAEAELIPANELNIEGMGEDWQRQIGWLRAFVGRWRDLSPMQVHLPALSPSGNYQEGYRAYRDAGLYRLFDAADVHCYPGSERDAAYVADISERPVSITEWNRLEPVAFLSGLDGHVRDAYYFILSGTEDQREYWLIGSPYYDDFKAWKEAPIVDTKPEFRLGFKALADQLGSAVVGDPVEDEHYWPDGTISVQTTTKGIMWYSKRGNQARFLPFGG